MKWIKQGTGEALYVDGVYFGHVQWFYENGPYYGTWEGSKGGRTGPMGDLLECKRRVEAKARPQ